MMSGIRKPLLLAVAWVIGLSLSSCSSSPALQLPLTAVGNIQMPHETKAIIPLFDLLTVDERRGILYVPHTSNSALEVVDTRTRKVIESIGGLPGARGVALTPDPNVIFVSDSTGGSIAVVDTNAMKVLGTIPVNGAPDAIAYDPVDDVVVASSSGAEELTLIDRTTRKVTGTVKLPGSPELLTVDPKAGIVYVAI